MSARSPFGKVLRSIGIISMGLTAGFTLLGGIGTSCVAFNPMGFGESMSRLASMQWLYVIFVVVGIALGILGIRSVVMLVKGTHTAYQTALSVLIAGILAGSLHVFVSRSLRGSSMPVDAVLYTTVLTFIIFLVLRIPSIWQAVDFQGDNTSDNAPAGGAAAIAVGLLALTIQHTMGSTHTWGGVNHAAEFNFALTCAGALSLIFGIGIWVNIIFGRNLGEKDNLSTTVDSTKHQIPADVSHNF